MKKLIKKVTSVFVAAVMAASMVVSAGAEIPPSENWEVSYSPYTGGAPSYIPIREDTYTSEMKQTLNTSGYSSFISRCTYFSSTEDSYGNPAYATYYCKIYNNDGKSVLGTTTAKNHYQVSNPSSGTTVSLPYKFSYGRFARATYTLKQVNNYGVTADIRGSFTFS